MAIKGNVVATSCRRLYLDTNNLILEKITAVDTVICYVSVVITVTVATQTNS